MTAVCLRIDVPLCSFRPFTARDYQQTYPAPPPATVLGMLMSLGGLELDQIERFRGVHLAVAVDRVGEVSIVLRKMRRDGDQVRKKGVPGYRPEYQEILADIVVWCLLLDTDGQPEPLIPHVQRALSEPSAINRHGVVSLGESTFLVDSIRVAPPPARCVVLCREPQGSYAMPVWVDHTDHARTRLERFSLIEGALHAAHAVAVGPA